MIRNTHQKYRLANFLRNKIFLKLVLTSFFSNHSVCLSMTQKQEINNLQLKGTHVDHQGGLCASGA